ncbi:helix-turn-helix domain-containing protein [Maricaulis sp. CAU 1757]
MAISFNRHPDRFGAAMLYPGRVNPQPEGNHLAEFTSTRARPGLPCDMAMARRWRFLDVRLTLRCRGLAAGLQAFGPLQVQHPPGRPYMAFKTDTAKIRRWREERHWSQEHLAELAGISLRTLQRIETGASASRDSLTALAAAFDVDALALCVDPEEESTRIAQTRWAKAAAGLRLSFWIHLISFAFGIVIFTAISLMMDTGTYVMAVPLIWWTIGLAGHGVAVGLVEVVRRHQTV